MRYSSDVAFSPAVKAVQERKGSRQSYARAEEAGSWDTRITPDLRAFIEAQKSVFLGTASALGQPYIQHRGGPPGFLVVMDDRTLGFADFVGNRQYITLGNLTENPRAHLFPDRLRQSQTGENLGRGQRRGKRSGALQATHAERLPGAGVASDRV